MTEYLKNSRSKYVFDPGMGSVMSEDVVRQRRHRRWSGCMDLEPIACCRNATHTVRCRVDDCAEWSNGDVKG